MNHFFRVQQSILQKIHLSFLKKNPQNSKFAAFWDLDGTIIDGDITEGKTVENLISYKGLMQILIEEEYLKDFKGKEGWNKFWTIYQSLDNDLEKGLFPAKILSQLSMEEFKKINDRCQKELNYKIAKYFYTFSLILMHSFKNLGIRNIIISASPQLLVKKVCPYLPVNEEDAYGIDYKNFTSKNDKIINYAEGKVHRLKQICKNEKLEAVFCAGNCNVSDGPMLDYVSQLGGISLFIENSKNKKKSEKKQWTYTQL